MLAVLIDNSVAVLAMLHRKIDDRVKRVATVLVIQHKNDLSTPYPRASRPGEFPRKRTGNLRHDVTTERVRDLVWRVGYGGMAPYILRLVNDMKREPVTTSAMRHLSNLKQTAEAK